MTLVALNELKKEIKKSIDDADEKTVMAIRAMLENEQEEDWWDTLPDAVKAGIDEGIKDMEEGRVTPHEEVWKKYSKWTTK